MLSMLTHRWWIPLLKGIYAVLAGLAIIFWVRMPALSLVLIFGIYCLIDGMLSFAIARDTQTRKSKLRRELWNSGASSMCAAAITLLWLDMGIVRLCIVAAQWALCHGIFEIGAWLEIRRLVPHERMMLRIGLMSILFNCILMTALILDMSSVQWMQWVMGIYIAIRGGLFIGMGIKLHGYKQMYQLGQMRFRFS